MAIDRGLAIGCTDFKELVVYQQYVKNYIDR